MEVVNELGPTTREQRAQFGEPGPDGPVVIVNLLKFRDKAAYPDGSDADLSGREAFRRYTDVVFPLIERDGGRVLFAGEVSTLLFGQVEELWDEVVLAEYPNRGALTTGMTTTTEFREAARHREAGLAGELAIEATHLAQALTATRPSA